MKVKTAILPAAGLGTRFLPITKSIPKEMLPVVDKPLIQYAVEEALASGIEKIIVVDSAGKSTIGDYFDKSRMLEMELAERGKHDLLKEEKRLASLVDIAFIRQKEAIGVGHAVAIALPLVGEEPFAVMFCDDVIDAEPPALKQMVDEFERLQNPIVAAMEVPEAMTHKYGILDTAEKDGGSYSLKGMIEKPPKGKAPGNLAIIGRYILTPDIIPILQRIDTDHTGEVQLTTALIELLGKRKIYGYRFKGERFDAGSKIGFLEANINYALKRDGMRADLLNYLKVVLSKED